MNNFNFDLDNTIDEDFFGTLKGKSSKLQQLFSDDSISQDGNQQSLKYQRPKATDFKQVPKNDPDASTSAKQASLTLMAKVVLAYKQGELQGKVGLALILNSNNTCGLIIYKTKSQLLATMKLEPGQDLLFKQTNFWQFYDEQSVYWSFSFDSLEDEVEFKEKLKSNHVTFKQSKEEITNSNEVMKPKELPNAQSIIESQDLKTQSKDIIRESKNSLIRRMAKMGKPLPTLPSFNQQTTTEFSDSSDTEVINTPLSLAQKPTIASRNSKLTAIKSHQQLMPSTVNAVYPINPLEPQYMQMLLTEQRTQGSELRMNMNKLENKIEKVLDKLDVFDCKDGKEKKHKDDEILELEEKLLMLKKENRKLKQSIEERSSRDTTDDMKIKAILQEFNFELKYLNIDYTNDLKSVLKALTEKLKDSQMEIHENEEHLKHNKTKLIDLLRELDSEKLIANDKEQQIKLLKEQEQILKANQQDKEKMITEYQQQINDLNHKLKEIREKPQIPADSLIKSIMNNLYSDVADKLDNSNLPHSDIVLALIASSIKQQTLKSLQKPSTKDD